MSIDVKRKGSIDCVSTSKGTFGMYMNTTDQSISSILNTDGVWDVNPLNVGGRKIIPNGWNNNLPADIRKLLEKNNLGPGILKKKLGLQYGQGPELYQPVYEKGVIRKEFCGDAEVQSWLDTWDYKKYIRESLIELNHLEGVWTRVTTGRYRRIGVDWITKLDCESSNDCRFEWVDSRRLEDVKNVLIWDFENMRRSEMLRYPVFQKYNPSQFKESIAYTNLRSFARYFYSIPSFMGSIPMMKRSNVIPEIFEALNDNMMSAVYIVHEPQAYWTDKEDRLHQMHSDWDEAKMAVEIKKLREENTKRIAEVLTGARNTGKFFECIDFTDDDGNLQQWKIEPIEMNIDKLVEAHSKISRIADSSTTSGFGLNPALSNIIIDGKSDSGSQMIYALKIFYASDTQIAEDIVFDIMNTAIKTNFPKKNLSMGLYRPVIDKEQDVTPSERINAKA